MGAANLDFAVCYGESEQDKMTVQKMFVKPAVPGTIVRQPDHNMQPLPHDGAWVVCTTFWMSRLLCGDIVETPPPPEIISDELAQRAHDAAGEQVEIEPPSEH